MKVQSLSIVVPNKKCVNNCKFCVSRMRQDEYDNNLNFESRLYNLYLNDYKERLEFARDNGCNTVMLTGTSEPQQNKKFLSMFGDLNRNLQSPFKCIEMQTTGVLLDDEYLYFLRTEVGVKTISLSLSSFDNDINADIIQMPCKVKVNIFDLCKKIKDNGFNLRLSLNLNRYMLFEDNKDVFSPQYVFKKVRELNADQVTFRILYKSNDNNNQDKWIEDNGLSSNWIDIIKSYIKENGVMLERTEFGQCRYDVDGISTVVDDDCMSKEVKETLKYLILREDCKLYTKWDTKASLLF